MITNALHQDLDVDEFMLFSLKEPEIFKLLSERYLNKHQSCKEAYVLRPYIYIYRVAIKEIDTFNVVLKRNY